jgi:UDP-glucose-4-epimerase GalE
MRILVTGGAGYIGSHTARELQSGGDSVVLLDRRTVDASSPNAGLPSILADVLDTALLTRVLQEHAIDAIIHFAGDKSVAESMADPGKYFRNNLGGSLSLLDAMVAAGTRRIVFSSSCSVYGQPSHSPVDESAPIDPISPYAESKAMTERALRWYGSQHGIRSVSLRYFNAAGAHPDGDLGEDWDTSTMLIPALLKAAAGRRGAVDLYGTDHPTPDGSAIRDYVHVMDLAAAHASAVRWLADATGDVSLNLGTGRGRSVRQVVALVESETGRPVPVRWVDRRPGDPAAVWADAGLARRVLGWAPRYDLTDMVRTAWRWHSS